MCREMEIMRNQAYEEGVEIGIKKGRMLQLIKPNTRSKAYKAALACL